MLSVIATPPKQPLLIESRKKVEKSVFEIHITFLENPHAVYVNYLVNNINSFIFQR